jgi:branched-chain amino acid aminotransferase
MVQRRVCGLERSKVHALSHVVHYGSSVFEGIRCYETKNGSAVFRLEEHVQRLYNSAKIYRMGIPYTQEEFSEAIMNTIKINNLSECYIRPQYSVDTKNWEFTLKLSSRVSDCCLGMGTYLGVEAIEQEWMWACLPGAVWPLTPCLTWPKLVPTI